MTDTALGVIEIILGLLLIVFIIMQSKGTGIDASFGGGISSYGTKRGAERVLFISTIIVAVLFLSVSLISVVF